MTCLRKSVKKKKKRRIEVGIKMFIVVPYLLSPFFSKLLWWVDTEGVKETITTEANKIAIR